MVVLFEKAKLVGMQLCWCSHNECQIVSRPYHKYTAGWWVVIIFSFEQCVAVGLEQDDQHFFP